MKFWDEIQSVKKIIIDNDYDIGVYYKEDGEQIHFTNGHLIVRIIDAYEQRGLKLLEVIEGGDAETTQI